MTDLVSMTGTWQRVESYRFELLDATNSYLGLVDVDMASPPTVDMSINRTVKRKLSGLHLPPSVTAQINTLTERIRPVMMLSDAQEFPLGVYLFGDASRSRGTGGSAVMATPGVDQQWTDAEMLDQSMTMLGGTNGYTIYGPGTLISKAIEQQFQVAGITDYLVDPSTARLSDWRVWKAADPRIDIPSDLCALGGYYQPYFELNGRARAKLVPQLDAVEPTAQLDAGRNVYVDSVVESDDLLDAPNRYIVVNTSLSEKPVWGYWDVPSSAPNSVQKRRFAVTKKYDIKGAESNSQAAQMAKAKGLADYATYRWATMDIVADPRLETYDVVSWLGDKYRLQSSRMPLEPGADMRLELRRIWASDVADLIYEEDAA